MFSVISHTWIRVQMKTRARIWYLIGSIEELVDRENIAEKQVR